MASVRGKGKRFELLRLTHNRYLHPPPLIDRHAQEFQDALQIVVVEESDIQRAFALPVTQLHFGPKMFPQLVFKIAHVRVADQRRRLGFGRG